MVVWWFQWIKDTIENIKKVKWTTWEINTSSQLDQNTKITTPTLESGNLFNSTQQPSLNWISGTVQTGVSVPQTNVFETWSIPSKDAYVIAKNTWGSLLDSQRSTLRDTANKILSSVWLAVGTSVTWLEWADWLNQKRASNRTKWWGQEIWGIVDFASNLWDIGWTLLTKADTKLTQWLDKLFWTEKWYTKESEAERIEWVKSIWKKVRELPDMFSKAQENYWWEIPEKEWVLWWMWDVAEQAWQMEAPILSSFLLWGWKKTMIATMFPVMYEESYDRFSQIEWATDEEVVLASTITALVKSIIEVAFWFENIITWWKSKALSKLLEKPILNFVKQMWLWVAWEAVIEEPLQAITDDIWAYLLWEESEYETLWSMLFSPDYWWYLVKDIMLPTARVTRPLVWISTHYSLTAEKSKKKAIDKTLEDYDKVINEWLKGYDTILTDDLENTMDKVFRRDDAYINLARVDDNYDEFVEDAREMDENISDEYLKGIWDYANQEKATIQSIESEIPEIEDTGNYEIAVDNEIQEDIDTNVDYLMEFSKEMEERFDRELAQDTNKTVKELKEQSQRTISDIKINSLVNETNETLQYLATEIEIESLDENGLKNNTPKFAFGRYQKPEWMVMDTAWKKWEWISSKATRNETEREYYKTRESLDIARRQANALWALIKRFNSSLNKSQKASPEDIKAVEDSMWGNLIGKEILLRDLENWRLVDAIFKAYRMIDTWWGTVKKLKAKANREAWKYVYRLNAESKDNDLIWFSTFVLKHKLKTRPTDAKDKAMIKNALYKMSKIFNIDMAKVFEWCNIIFLDYNGSSKKNAWWTMEWFIDWNWTPVIPISLNYMWWKESTVIHELIHWLDFVYQYRNGWVSFIENDSLFYSANFLYTLNREFPSLYKKLVNEMTPWDGKKIWYWTKPTEVMSRIFQEYYEYYVLNEKETVEDPYHWKDITLVKDSVNKLLDLFREEFGISPVLNWNETVEEYNKKIDESVEKFNSDDTWQFMEMINKVWTEMKLLRLKTDITKETEGNRGEDYLNNLISLAEYEFQWWMLMELGQEYTDVLLWTKKWLYEITQDIEYEDTVRKEIDRIVNLIENSDYWIITKEEKKKYKKEIRQYGLSKAYKALREAKRDIIDSVMERLKRIAPDIAWSLAKMEVQAGIKSNRYRYNVKWFMDKYKKLTKGQQDKLHNLLFDYQEDVNKDSNVLKWTLLEYADRLWMKDEIKVVLDTLEIIAEEYRASWLKLTNRDLYFPRIVKDYDWLIAYLNAVIEEWKWDVDYKKRHELITDLQNVVNNKNNLSENEQNRRIRNILEDLTWRYAPKRIASDSEHQLQRKISTTEDWWVWILKYYEKPDVALEKFISNMVSNIEQAKFFGRWFELDNLAEATKVLSKRWIAISENAKELIRRYTNWEDIGEIRDDLIKEIIWNELLPDYAEEIADDILQEWSDIYEGATQRSLTKLLKQRIKWDNEVWLKAMNEEDAEELKKVLEAYFGRRTTPTLIQVIKNLTYLATLTNFNSTLRQFWDIWFALDKDPTLVKSIANTVLKKTWINVDVVGIENIFEDLRQDKNNWLSWLLQKELTVSWFKKTDMAMKDFFLNSAFVQSHRMAKSKKQKNMLQQRLDTVWGKDKGKIIFDIYEKWELPYELNEKWEIVRESNWSPRIDLEKWIDVLVDLWYQIGEVQPIYRSAMTVAYLKYTALRALYWLRTWSLTMYNLLVYWTRRTYRNYRMMWESVTKSSYEAWKYVTRKLLIYSLADVMASELINAFMAIFYEATGRDDERWQQTLLYQWTHFWPKKALIKLADDMFDAWRSLLLYWDMLEQTYRRQWVEWIWGNFLPPAFDTLWDMFDVMKWTLNAIAWQDIVSKISHPRLRLVWGELWEELPKSRVKHPAILVPQITPFIWKWIYEWFGLKDYASEHKRPRENKSSWSEWKSKKNATSDWTPIL